MKLNTHKKINESLNGKLVELTSSFAKVNLETTELMVADEQGLIHGGFIFGAADYAAMALINEPYVVLAKSETKFLAPVKVTEVVKLTATIIEKNGIKSSISVEGKVGENTVFKGIFYTATLDRHVFEVNKA